MTMIVFLFSLFAYGSSVDSIIESSTVEELVLIEKESFQRSRLERRCDEEKKSHLFPKSCFLSLLESVDLSVDKKSWRSKKNHLNRLCEQRSHSLSSLQDLEEIQRLSILSIGCRKALSEQEKDLLYIQEKEKWPQS